MTGYSVSPDPPCKGQMVTICFDGPLPTTIEVTFTPGSTTMHPVTTSDPCFSVSVPSDAITCIAHDVNEGADDYTSPCKDC